MFHQISLPPAVDSPARRRRRGTRHPGAGGGGPGAGEARRALTSSTVSGMQIRYSFSSMVLPAADPRSGKRGRGWGRAPQNNKAAAQAQSKTPGAPHSEPADEAAPAVRSASGFLLSTREHVKVWVRVFATPPASFLAEVGPPGTRRFKVRDRGRKPR